MLNVGTAQFLGGPIPLQKNISGSNQTYTSINFFPPLILTLFVFIAEESAQ